MCPTQQAILFHESGKPLLRRLQLAAKFVIRRIGNNVWW